MTTQDPVVDLLLLTLGLSAACVVLGAAAWACEQLDTVWRASRQLARAKDTNRRS